MPQHITVLDYDTEWIPNYRQERERLSRILQDNCLALYHIGSTSVPGLAARPVIDILGVVRSLEKADAVADRFADCSYECLGECGMPGRRCYHKGGDDLAHQIHLFQAEDWTNIGRHLAFRDFLRTHAEEREAYARLKKELALRFPWNIEGYLDGKDAFVREMEERALALFDGTWDKLYLAARRVQQERRLSPLVEAGSVAAALLSKQGSIYVGVCIDTACSLGMCAERNAIASMITHGESIIRKILAVQLDGSIVLPCGVCRECMRQLGNTAGETEILCDYETKRVLQLKELLPEWWGTEPATAGD